MIKLRKLEKGVLKMKQKILIMALSTYRFKEDNGDLKEGASIEYVSDALNDTNDYGCKVGYLSMKQAVSLEHDVPLITKLPAIYEVDLAMKSGKDRKPQIVMTAFNFVSDVKLGL